MNRALITESLRIGSHQLISSGSGLYVYDVLQGKFPFLISSHIGSGIQIRNVIVNENYARFIYTNNQSNFVYGFHNIFVKKGDSVNVFNDFEVIPSIYKSVLISEPNSGKVTNELIIDHLDDTTRLVSAKAIKSELESYLKITDPLLEGSQNKNGNILVWRNTAWVAEPLTSSQLKDSDITLQNGSVLRILSNKIKNESVAQNVSELNKVVVTDLLRNELQHYLHKNNDSASSQYMVLHWTGTQWESTLIDWNHLTNIAGVLQNDQLVIYRNGKLESSNVLSNYVTSQNLNQTLTNYLNITQGNGDYLYFNGTQWTGNNSIKTLSDIGTDNNRLITAGGMIAYLSNEKETSISQNEKIATGSAVITYVRDYVQSIIDTYRIDSMYSNFRTIIDNVSEDNEARMITKSANGGQIFNYLRLDEFKETVKTEIGSGIMAVEISSGSGNDANKGPVLYYTPNLGSKTELSEIGIVAYDRSGLTIGAGFDETKLYYVKFNETSKLFELKTTQSQDVKINSIQQSSNQFHFFENGNIDCSDISCDNVNIQTLLTTRDLTCSGTLTASGSGIFETLSSQTMNSNSGTITNLNVDTITITGSSTFQDVTSTSLSLTNLVSSTASITSRLEVPSLVMNHGNGLQTNITNGGMVTNTSLIFYNTGQPPVFSQPTDFRIRDGNFTILNTDRELENIVSITTTNVVSQSITNSSNVTTNTLDVQSLSCTGTGDFNTVSCQNLEFDVVNENLTRNSTGVINFTFSDSIFQTGGIVDQNSNDTVSSINFSGQAKNGFQFYIVYERPSTTSAVNVLDTFSITENGSSVTTVKNVQTLQISPGSTYLIEGRRLINGNQDPVYFVDFKQYF